MPGELTPHQGGLEPDEEYDGLKFADTSFTDADAAGTATSSTASSPASPSTAAG